MKKHPFFIFIAAALLTAGCTSPEQDQKIRLFWMQQYAALTAKITGGQPRCARQTPPPPGLSFRPQQPGTKTSAQPRPQVMDVTIETEALPGIAPYAERVRMKRAWDAVQIANQNTLDDISSAFGEKVKNQAFAVTTNTEKQLKQTAKEASNFAAYFTQQRALLSKQEQALNTLMTQNRTRIKKLKKTNTTL